MLRRLYGSSPRHNFHILDYHHILSLKTSVMTLEHDRTGHTFVHLERDDPHLVHGIAFRTPVSNDKGIPHILEHLALCGSHRFPVRDPFFKMLNRSLATYMNAWTAADYTFYPFSTENVRDYRNLREIYSDAVFNPLLKENDFMQEGWRLSNNHNDTSNDSNNLGWNVKGVVYNEMKGALSDIDSLFLHQVNRVLFQGSKYEYNSGGDPSAIPLLSLQELKDYYNSHYTPENSLTVCYGNIDLEEQLKFLDQNILLKHNNRNSNKNYNKKDETNRIQKRVEVKGPLDPSLPEDKQVRYLRAWICNDVRDVQETFDLKVLSSLLLDGPAAPLHQALLETAPLGTDYAPGTGYDASSSLSSFGIGLQGLRYEDVPKVSSIIKDTLERVAREGFAKERIEGVLHQMTLDLRYHSSRFGLGAASTIASAWAHGVDLSEALDVDRRIQDFTKNCLGTDRLQQLIRKYLLTGSMDVIMTPSKEYNTELQRREQELVQSLVQSKDSQALQEIKVKNEELEREQQIKEDMSLLPMLKLTEIPETPRHLSIPFVTWPSSEKPSEPIAAVIKERYANNSPLSNQLTFFKLLGIQREFKREDLVYLPLAMNALTELGIKGMSAEEYESIVRKTCAGLSVSAYLCHKKENRDDDLRVLLSSRCLDEKTEETMELFARTVRECNWTDAPKVRTLIGQMAADALGGVASNGHRYASLQAASLFGKAFQARNAMGGLDQVYFLQNLLRSIQEDETDLLHVCSKLESVVNEFLMTKSSTEWRTAVVRGDDAEDLDLNNLLTKITNTTKYRSVIGEYNNGSKGEVMTFPFNSNYVAVCYHWPEHDRWNWEEKAAWSLFCHILRSKVLHVVVREQGGAYGSSASMDTRLGLLSLTSYRDPTPTNTIRLYKDLEGLLGRVEESVGEEVVLGEAELGVMQGLDAPMDLARQGMQRFLYDVEDEQVIGLRSALLSMTSSKLIDLMRGILKKQPFNGPSEYVIQSSN